MFTLGFAEPSGAVPSVIVFLAAATGLVIVTLQIAYLPTLYSAFNRRETEVALLNARAGVPSWGPELLARTHYALGSGMSTLGTMPDLYAQWERWAADIAESHTTYLPLVRFRSPGPLSSWVTGLLAVLDSAALFLALSPGAAPVVPARLCLRGGFLCFNRIARAMGIQVPEQPDRGVAGLRRLADQLRAGGLCGGRRRRRGARTVVRPTPASHPAHRTHPSARVGTPDSGLWPTSSSPHFRISGGLLRAGRLPDLNFYYHNDITLSEPAPRSDSRSSRPVFAGHARPVGGVGLWTRSRGSSRW
jgi:hypothetical protein